MATKTIDLVVLENEQESRTPILKITWSESFKKANFRKLAPVEELLSGAGWQYTARSLSRSYVMGIDRIHTLFKTITDGTDLQNLVTYEYITARPFAYVRREAYEKIKPVIPLEKEKDTKVNPVAHLCWNKGIFISLNQHRRWNNLVGLNVHEHGHHMHYLLHPKHYASCDPTMIELMAIFTMINCDIEVNYQPAGYDPRTNTGETTHYRAERLLRQLDKKKEYSYLTKADQWVFFLDFHEHQELQEYIDEMF